MFLVIFLFVNVFSSLGWKQLGCNSYGNFRSDVMGHLSDWNKNLSSATVVTDMILTSGNNLILQTKERRSGYWYCGMTSLDFDTGKVVSTTSECSTAFAGTISRTVDGIYVYGKSRQYNYTAEVIAVSGKLEEIWRFSFLMKNSDNNPVAVLPIKEDTIIVVTGPSTYPESGIGYMHYSEVWCFDSSSTPNGDPLKPKWVKPMRRGSVLFYDNYLYFKSSDNMLKVDPSSGKVVYEDPIPYPRVYSNIIVSKKHGKMIYNCGLPEYADPNHNQCCLDLDNFTIGAWTHRFSGDYSCFNIALSNDESLFYVQCKYGSWSTNYRISAMDVLTGEIVSTYNYSGMADSSFRKMSAVVMNDGSVIVPLVSKIIVFDSKLKNVKLTIDWDKNMAFYGAMLADNFKCFSYCLSAEGYGSSKATCHKRCI